LGEIVRKILQLSLKYLAKIYLFRTKPAIIVIAGATNRHWIKEGILETLKEKGISCRGNKKNFNAEVGLPLSVLGVYSEMDEDNKIRRWFNVLLKLAKSAFFEKGADYLVLEMAIDKPDDMEYLLGIIKPQTAVFTTITMIYPENFSNLDEIALEYKKLIKGLPQNGMAILNADDERIISLKEYSPARVFTYGIESPDPGFMAKDIKKSLVGQEFLIQTPDSKTKTVKINKFGQHHIYAELVKEVIVGGIIAKSRAANPK
jgi:UDP-N-acetylmuramyl pentapeptide synthase